MKAKELIELAQRTCQHVWKQFGWTCHTEPSDECGVTTYVMDKALSSCSECGAHKEGRMIKIMLPS